MPPSLHLSPKEFCRLATVAPLASSHQDQVCPPTVRCLHERPIGVPSQEGLPCCPSSTRRVRGAMRTASSDMTGPEAALI
nr:hypothetical protein CFP56_01068 [Quercus suber]